MSYSFMNSPADGRLVHWQSFGGKKLFLKGPNSIRRWYIALFGGGGQMSTRSRAGELIELSSVGGPAFNRCRHRFLDIDQTWTFACWQNSARVVTRSSRLRRRNFVVPGANFNRSNGHRERQSKWRKVLPVSRRTFQSSSARCCIRTERGWFRASASLRRVCFDLEEKRLNERTSWILASLFIPFIYIDLLAARGHRRANGKCCSACIWLLRPPPRWYLPNRILRKADRKSGLKMV